MGWDGVEVDQGRNMALVRFSVVSGGAILPPWWPDRPAIWEMSVEHKQGMVAGPAEVAIIGRVLLIAESRADAGVHVQHDSSHRAAFGDAVYPSARQRDQ